MDISQDEVISRYSPLARSIAQKYSKLGVPFEDLLQEGLLGILDAYNRFDEKKGTKFSTYATYWIKKRIIANIDRERKQSHDSIELVENILPEEKVHPGAEEKSKINLPGDMPNLEKKVMIALFEQQKTMAEIAEELNISRERVRQIKEKALRRLRALSVEKTGDKMPEQN